MGEGALVMIPILFCGKNGRVGLAIFTHLRKVDFEMSRRIKLLKLG